MPNRTAVLPSMKKNSQAKRTLSIAEKIAEKIFSKISQPIADQPGAKTKPK